MNKILFLLALSLSINLNGQFRFDSIIHSVTVSVNHSNTGPSDYSQDFGFGLSFNHIAFRNNRINLLTGLEFNRTNQFVDNLYESRFAISENILYTMNYISVPLGVRLNIDRSQYISIECGAFVDLLLRGTKTGTMHTAIPDNNIDLVINEYDFSDEMKRRDYFGLYLAFNIQIPFLNNWLIVKPESKIGLTPLYDYQDRVDNHYIKLNIGYRFR